MTSENIRAVFRLDNLVAKEEREALKMKLWFEEQLKRADDALASARSCADLLTAEKAAEVYALYTKCLETNAQLQLVVKRLRSHVDDLLVEMAEDKKAEYV